MRTKRTILNLATSIASKLITLILGILIPKLYIDNFGSEINGLLSSVAGLFVYINLLEAGVGGASLQALYAPMAQDDTGRINSILSATNIYYRRTGIIFLACVSILTFLYPLLIKSTLSYFTIAAVISISAISFALKYFFIGKYSVLLNADNKSYILTSYSTIFYFFSSLLTVALILAGFNFVLVQLASSCINVIQVIAVYLYVKKTYSRLDLSVKPDFQAISQKNSVIVHQVAGVIFGNTDVLILMIFCDLKVVSIYTIYNMIFNQTGFLPNVFSASLTSGFGQLYSEDINKFKKVFNFFEVYYTALVFAVYVVAYILILPFLQIYMANADINYIDNRLPFLFLCVNILSTARWPSVIAINIAGHFSQTKWRAILEISINIIVSLVLVNKIGIYGVLIGTIVALLYRAFDLIIYSSKNLLERRSIIPIRRWLVNIIIGFVLILIMSRLHLVFSNYLQFIAAGFLLLFSVGAVYFLFASIFEKQAYIVLKEYYSEIIKKLKSRRGKLKCQQ